MKHFRLVLAGILVCIPVSVSVSQTLAGNSPKDWSVIENSEFDGESLWGYMNGGADLYLEYGFKKLIFQKLEIAELKYQIELFEMLDPLSAWGIFSVNHRKCQSRDTLISADCLNTYQYQNVKGNYYLNIVALQKSDKNPELFLAIARILLNQIPRNDLRLPSHLESFDMNDLKKRLKIYKGNIAVNNNLFEWSEWVSNIPEFSIYQILPENSSSPKRNYLVSCAEASVVQFYKNIGIQSDNNLGIIQKDGIKYSFERLDNGIWITEEI